jgi:hypothetical protein
MQKVSQEQARRTGSDDRYLGPRHRAILCGAGGVCNKPGRTALAVDGEVEVGSPGAGGRQPAAAEYANESGRLRVLNAAAAFDSLDHL